MGNNEESRFCTKCGKQLAQQATASDADDERTPQVTPQPAQPPAPQQYTMPQKIAKTAQPDKVENKKPKGAVFLGVAIGVVASVLVYIALYFIIGLWSEDNGGVEGAGYAGEDNGRIEEPGYDREDDGRLEEQGYNREDRGRIEGPGFDSAEDAVLAYLDAFSNADLEAMIATFAIESFVENYDLEASIERIRVYSVNLQQRFPSSNRFTTSMNTRQRQAMVVEGISWQYMTIFVPDSDLLHSWSTIMDDAQEIREFMRDLGDPAYLRSLSTMNFVGFVDPNRLNDRFDTEQNQQNIERIRDIMGAQRLENIVARVDIDGQTYLFCFDVLLYDGKWYIHSLGGNIGLLLGLPFQNGGVILEAYLQW